MRRTIRTLAVAVVVVLLASCAADAGVSAWLEGTWTCQITRAGDPWTDATVTVGTTAWTGGGGPGPEPLSISTITADSVQLTYAAANGPETVTTCRKG